MLYSMHYIACNVIIPNSLQINRIIFLMTGYAIMFKPASKFFFCTQQFGTPHVPLGYMQKDP